MGTGASAYPVPSIQQVTKEEVSKAYQELLPKDQSRISLALAWVQLVRRDESDVLAMDDYVQRSTASEEVPAGFAALGRALCLLCGEEENPEYPIGWREVRDLWADIEASVAAVEKELRCHLLSLLNGIGKDVPESSKESLAAFLANPSHTPEKMAHMSLLMHILTKWLVALQGGGEESALAAAMEALEKTEGNIVYEYRSFHLPPRACVELEELLCELAGHPLGVIRPASDCSSEEYRDYGLATHGLARPYLFPLSEESQKTLAMGRNKTFVDKLSRVEPSKKALSILKVFVEDPGVVAGGLSCEGSWAQAIVTWLLALYRRSAAL
eukprot:TRINITY_DN4248_c0_g1_i2.p1 TRINITY_DN4248_c0_g1~~TRINITY_DN4248_c0_g1_i2.p1  ORF type:complete len:327 (+),score=79.21 TRINITY_DN4248_c0_g1_i2:89-1069(+)